MASVKESLIKEMHDIDRALHGEHHRWRFVETIKRFADYSQFTALTYSVAREWARMGGDAVDVVEKPHHFAEQHALHLVENPELANESAVASAFGFWECKDCPEQTNALNDDALNRRDCAAGA
jgi:hypothetical protein